MKDEEADGSERDAPRRRGYPGRQMSERAKELHRDQTPAEARVWEIVRDRRCAGWRFYRQVPVGQYILDFCCPQARFVLEVDGSIHDLPDVREYDIARQQAMEEETGLIFLRLPNHEVLTSASDALSARIADATDAAAHVAPNWNVRPSRRR